MKWLFYFCAAVSFTDACVAISELQHFGDMHISWAGNSLIAMGVFIVWARAEAANQ